MKTRTEQGHTGDFPPVHLLNAERRMPKTDIPVPPLNTHEHTCRVQMGLVYRKQAKEKRD